jgi:sigma-E factor negative regulatory protein RseB
LTVVQFFLGLALVVATSVSVAESTLTAKQVLQKMVGAMAVSNYQGTVVFLKNDKLEAMKYSHTVEKDREQERLVSLNSPQREIVRNSDEVRCFYKLTRQVIVDHRPYEHSFIVDVPKNLDELDASYQFELAGEEDVAMLPSYVIAIQPKDDFRYARKIWIGKAQFLPLKAVVYDLTGLVLEQVVFTDIEFNHQPQAKVVNVAGMSPQMEAPVRAAESINQPSFELTALPQGFKQIFFTRKPVHQNDQPVDHLLLSDGFASVSVYLEPKKANASVDSNIPEGIHKVGAVNSLSRTMTGFQLTVLGEVPPATVKYMAEGVKLRNSAP